MVWNGCGFHFRCFCKLCLLHWVAASSISAEERSKPSRHASLQIDARGRALMRQDALVEAPQDTFWARFFGTGSASVPDLAAYPADPEAVNLSKLPAAAKASAKKESTDAKTESGKKSAAVKTESSDAKKESKSETKSSSKTNSETSSKKEPDKDEDEAEKSDGKAEGETSHAPVMPVEELSLPTEDCEDTWKPEWSAESDGPSENCKKWASNSDWGALSLASSLKAACKSDQWAQANCMSTCGCEVVKGIRLDVAILEKATVLGASEQQLEEATKVLETITASGKEAVLQVMGTAAAARESTEGKGEAGGNLTGTVGEHSGGTTLTTTAAASDILEMSGVLGFQNVSQLNATLRLINPKHYSDVLEVLNVILKSSTASVAVPASANDIVRTALNLGLKEEDVALMNASLKRLDPSLHDEILATVNESRKLVEEIGLDRTGKAIVRHLQNLTRPSRERLPQKDEPNDFLIQVASADARTRYKETQGRDALGFYLKVSLPVKTVVDFIQDRVNVTVDPRKLSLVISRLEFSWPSSSCSDDESGFTDFKLLNYPAGKMMNTGTNCGSLVASSVDKNHSLLSDEDLDLFLLAGMFGSKYANSTDGGDVNLKIAQLVFHELRDNGDTIEYSICGRGSLTWKEQHFYLGCPAVNPLRISSTEKGLGDGVKLCGGAVPSEDESVQAMCFSVAE